MSENEEVKHLDATKPGIAPVSHTSKPALVGSSQLQRDPMMREPEPPESKLNSAIQDHKKPDLQPTTTKAEIEAEQPVVEKLESDQELPKGVIESKAPIVDEQSVKIQELIDKKAYNLPIQSTPTKTLLKIVTIAAIVIALAAAGFVVFAMN